MEIKIESAEEWAKMIPSFLDCDSVELTLCHVRKLREYLYQQVPNSTCVEEIFQSGIVPYLISFLAHENLELKKEAAWALTNLIVRDSIYAEKTLGAVPLLIAMIEHSNVEVSNQAVWCIGNCATEPLTREVILAHGGFQSLLNVVTQKLEHKQNLFSDFLELVTWALSNLCMSLSSANLLLVSKKAVPIFYRLLDSPIVEVQVNICKGLIHLSQPDEKKVLSEISEVFEEHKILLKLIELIPISNDHLLEWTLKVMENMSVHFLLDRMKIFKILSTLDELLFHSNQVIRSLVCRIVSCLVRDSNENIQTIIDKKFLPRLVKLFLCDNYIHVKIDSACIFKRLVDSGDVKQVEYFINLGLVPLLLNSWDSIENIHSCSRSEKYTFLLQTVFILKKCIDRSKKTDSKICQQFLSSLKNETYMSKFKEFAVKQEKTIETSEHIQSLLKEIENLINRES